MESLLNLCLRGGFIHPDLDCLLPSCYTPRCSKKHLCAFTTPSKQRSTESELLGPPLSYTAPSQTGLCKTRTKRTGTSSTLLSPFTLAFRSASCFSCFSGARKLPKPVQQCHRSSEVLARRLEPLSCLRHTIPSCQVQPGGGRNAAPVPRRGRVQRAPPAIWS